MKIYVEIKNKKSPKEIKKIPIDPKKRTIVGRSKLSTVHIDDPKLSRHHCTIFSKGNNFYIQDNKSKNGTFLNNKKLDKTTVLASGDIINIGDYNVTFFSGSQKKKVKERIKELGKYKIIKKIGEGGIGRVYRVTNKEDEKTYALKILKSEATEDSEIIARFLKEARVCISLNHPNIVKIYEVDFFRQMPYIVMEYIDGRALDEIVHERGPMACTEAFKIIEQAASALYYSHLRDVVHRDIKPGNIILLQDDTIRLIDMGMVKVLNESGMTMQGDILGTPRYMSPEQIEDSSDVDGRTDIYSLGATLYHLISGKPPYWDIDSKVLGKYLRHIYKYDPKPLSELISVPMEVENLVRKSMEKNPKYRFADMELFLREVQKVRKKIK